ncbi:MAG: response regulator [Oceanospirillaceae bacterium]|nr:response regulator [Oceanospirillaceae bacterium]
MQKKLSGPNQPNTTIKPFSKKNSLNILIAGFVLATSLIFIYLHNANDRAIISSAIESSRRYAEVISQFRSLYTSEVVARAQHMGIEFSHDFVDKKNTLPLPATMTFMLSEKMRDNGLTIKTNLYSLYPFPWRKATGGLRGDFEKSAWKALTAQPDKPFSRIEEVDGVLSIRYAIADTLKTQCVACHNNHPDTPKTGWKEGDLRGVLEIIEPLSVGENNVSSIFLQMSLLFSILILLAFSAFYYIFKNLQKNNLTLDNLNHELNASIELHKKHQIEILKAKEHALTEKAQADLAREEAVDANKAKSIFLANISHEIRTPMNAILGYTQILQTRDEFSGDNKQSLAIISKSGNHLLNIINDILDLSKLESGITKLNIGNFDLIETCTSALEMFGLKATQNNIFLEFNTDIPLERLIVNGDQLKLRQVLINLLGNAIKFTSEGKISLSLNMLEDSVFNIKVTDTGIGISPKHRHSIFDAFNQGNVSFKYGGTGLGLSISKKYLKMMLSDIQLQSELGKGSCFYFDICLPIQKKAIRISKSLPDNNSLNFARDTVKSILVVDDILLNRSVLERVLTDQGYQVFCAKNAFSALSLLKIEVVDLVFTDIMMPVMNGLELVQQIKQRYPQLPVIAISASTLENDPLYYQKLGFDDFIGKPFKFASILKLVDVYLHTDKLSTHKSPEIMNGDLAENSEFHLPPEFCELIIEQCDLYLVKEVEIIIERLMAKYPNNDTYFSQLQQFVNDYDLEGLTSFLTGDTNAR